MYHPSPAHRPRKFACGGSTHRGFTLIELLVVVGIIALLVGILVPSLSYAHNLARRTACATNLMQMGTAMHTYAENDLANAFPRAPFESKQHLQLDNAGYLVPDTFGHSGYVGINNVPASLFLLIKTQQLSPKLFLCPAAPGTPGFTNSSPMQSSNWERIPENMTYSLATPFPGPTGLSHAFHWDESMDSTFALISDINPGTRGGTNPPNNVTGPAHTAGAAALAAANSNNHANKGQNVLYVDNHAEFQKTPYSGAIHRSTGIADNIFTAGDGDFGLCGDTAQPVDGQDSVMLPTDDPGGK